jgi:small multidrug resistance pump
MSIFLLLISGSCSAVASILLRLAGQAGGIPAMLAQAPPMVLRVAALGAYGVGFLLYAVALKRVELSIAYPVMVAVTVIELFVFSAWSGDTMSIRTASGAALLVAGVWLIYSSQAKVA